MYIVWLLCALFGGVAHGESVCDEVDILFAIDDESVLANGGDDIIDFIKYIALRESGEFAGFSVGVYGDQIPVDFPEILVNLVDTEAVHQRAPLIGNISEILRDSFNEIVSNVEDGGAAQSVSLTEVFNAMTNQPEPQRQHLKRDRICGVDKDCEMGLHDDSKRIFVFDHSSKLVVDMDEDSSPNDYADRSTTNEAICEIIDYIESGDTMGEGLLIMTGSVADGKVGIFCDGEMPSMLEDQQNMIIPFDSDILDDGHLMEYIGSMTCPANMVTPEGTMDLGNHVQWMDAETIVSCHTEYLPWIADKGPANQLTAESYIVVKDFKNDTNSFLLNDYLMADQDTTSILPTECGPLYQIAAIETIETGMEYDTLKLSVQLPQSMMEYIYEIHANGTGLNVDSDDIDDELMRRRMRFWDYAFERQKTATVVDLKFGPYKLSHQFNLGEKELKTWGKPPASNHEWDANLDGGDAEEIQPLLGGAPSATPSHGIVTRPTVTLEVDGKLQVDLEFFASLLLTANFNFSYSIFKGDVHMNLTFHGNWQVVARMDLAFQAVIKMKIEDLLKWSTPSKILWIGEAPILYHPFMTVGIDVETVPAPLLGFGGKLDISQNFAVGFYHNSVSCGRKCPPGNSHNGYKVDEDYIHDFGPITKHSSMSDKYVGMEKFDDQCPTALQKFGFDVKPYLKVGAVIYELVNVYAKPELNFPFRLTMPESHGPTCGNPADWNMCERQNHLKASWSIGGSVAFKVGYKVTSMHDLVYRIWNHFTNFRPNSQAASYAIPLANWFVEEFLNEFEIAKKEFVKLAGCFTLPRALDKLYRPLCCSQKKKSVECPDNSICLCEPAADLNKQLVGTVPVGSDLHFEMDFYLPKRMSGALWNCKNVGNDRFPSVSMSGGRLFVTFGLHPKNIMYMAHAANVRPSIKNWHHLELDIWGNNGFQLKLDGQLKNSGLLEKNVNWNAFYNKKAYSKMKCAVTTTTASIKNVLWTPRGTVDAAKAFCGSDAALPAIPDPFDSYPESDPFDSYPKVDPYDSYPKVDPFDSYPKVDPFVPSESYWFGVSHNDLLIALCGLLAVLCGLNLYVSCQRKQGIQYVGVKRVFDTDTECDIEVQPMMPINK